MEKETAVENVSTVSGLPRYCKAIWFSTNMAIRDPVKIQRRLEIYWSVDKNWRCQGWEAVSCLSGSWDNRAGESWHCPSCHCQEDEKWERWLLPSSGQCYPPPGMSRQHQEFPGWFLQGSDVRKRDNNLIRSSPAWGRTAAKVNSIGCSYLRCCIHYPDTLLYKHWEARLAKCSDYLDFKIPASLA